MLRKTSRFTSQAGASRLSICALVWLGAAALGCADDKEPEDAVAQPASTPDGGTGDAAPVGAVDAGGSVPDAGGMVVNADAGGGAKSPAACNASDTPEKGLQGDVNPGGTVNCGLKLLSELPVAGSAQGSGHCAYVRVGGVIKAFSLADPLNPVQTDEQPGFGGSESMRAQTVEGRAILVSGRGVYDISNCEKLVKKGEIAWPSQNAASGLLFAALSSHEISISHDAKRVYSGLGFNIAYLDDLEKPETWIVKDWSCEMNVQSGFPQTVPNACDGPSHQDVGRQYSHSSDDNAEGTVWYGANQEGSATQMERSTARMVDISNRDSIKILDTVAGVPGHSMNWWKTPDAREFILGANETLAKADSCVPYPRPVNLGNAYEGYIVEVTGKKFGKPLILTLDINRPENCQVAKASGSNATITEHSVYNKNGAAFVMLEYGSAGTRVFDLRNGENPKEAAYYNDGKGLVHSGVFHYDDARGILISSGRSAAHVLVLESEAITALGLPKPTDPKYPYK